jgi:hypothetical protein
MAGRHGRQSGTESAPRAFHVHLHVVRSTPAGKHHPISMGLCRIASWRCMPMQHGIDVCTGCGPEPLYGHSTTRISRHRPWEVTGTRGDEVREQDAHP